VVARDGLPHEVVAWPFVIGAAAFGAVAVGRHEYLDAVGREVLDLLARSVPGVGERDDDLLCDPRVR
jgi:hypothetical protein